VIYETGLRRGARWTAAESMGKWRFVQEGAIDPRPPARKLRLTRESPARLTDLINCVRAARYFAYRQRMSRGGSRGFG